MKKLSVLIGAVFGLALPFYAHAAAGDLDPSFGSGGKVLTDFSGLSEDHARSVAVEPGGKVVVAGFSDMGGGRDFALARYHHDGSLDPSFGSGGKVLTDFGGPSDLALDAALAPNGKIVAAGTSDFDFAVARYNRDGSLDPSFGSGGTVITGFGPGSFDEAWGVALEPGGKIVVAGESGGDFALVRYDRNGNLDPSFGSGGKVLTDIGGASSDAALAVAVEPDGKIVATGNTGTAPFTDFDFALVRYNRDGNVDPTFGSGGRVVTAFGVARFDEAWGVAIQPEGKIVVAGLTDAPADDEFAVARYDHDGSPDPSFGSGGKIMSGSIGQEAFDVALEPSGKAIVAGDGFGTSEDFAVARFLAR